jgi:hypothetical protein
MSRRVNEHVTDPVAAGEPESPEDPDLAVDAPLTGLVHPLREESGSTSAGTMRAGEAGSIEDSDQSTWDIEVGTDVLCTGGNKLGEVVAIKDDYIVVEKGFFMPEDVFVPKSAISDLDEHALHLNVSKSEALHSGWDEDPDAREAPEPGLA